MAAIPSHHRELYDRVHRLVLEAHPRATTAMSYSMPSYVVGGSRLHVGRLEARPVVLRLERGTGRRVRRPAPGPRREQGDHQAAAEAAERIDDDELRDFFHATLAD